jgi:2,3-bisphosphoglycerate-dependent phosphoglycerate mutase
MPLDSSTRILAIRHGETAWNRDTRIQGHLDIPLNEFGLAQASRLTEALQSETLDAVYCSDLARARQTAQGLAASAGLPLHEEAGLRERSFGIFEGLTWQEIALRWPEQSLRWRQRDAEFGAEGGETLAAFYARCIAMITRIAAAHPGQTVVIVAHGGVMDCLYRAATRLALDAPRSWTLGNAAINRLLYSPEGFSLIGWNDDAHLQGLSLDEIEPA